MSEELELQAEPVATEESAPQTPERADDVNALLSPPVELHTDTPAEDPAAAGPNVHIPDPTVKPSPQPELLRLTPAQWAERKGQPVKPDPNRPWIVAHPDWRHAAADTLYGWTLTAYHYQNEPQLLSEREYDMALDAASQYPAAKPFKPAIGRACPHKFTPEELS